MPHMMDEMGRWVNDRGYKPVEAAAKIIPEAGELRRSQESQINRPD